MNRTIQVVCAKWADSPWLLPVGVALRSQACFVAHSRPNPGISFGFLLRGREITRLESLSDAVFGFALNVLVVSLDVPETSSIRFRYALWRIAAARGRVRVVVMTPAEQDEQFYRDTESIAFPKLSDEQLALLEPLGKRRALRRGDFVFKAGQREFDLTITLDGELEVFEARDGVEQILATSHVRGFLGDVSMLQVVVQFQFPLLSYRRR